MRRMKRKMKKMKSVRKPWMLQRRRQKHQTVSIQGVQVNSGKGEIHPPVQPFPCRVTHPLMDWPSLPSPQQLPFGLILWNPWATANNTQNTPSCFPLKQALS